MLRSFFTAAPLLQRPGVGKPARRKFDSAFCNIPLARLKPRRWVLALAPPLLLLTSLPAQATAYTFPGDLPAGCSAGGVSGGTLIFNCGAVTLAAADAIIISAPTQLNIAGDFTAGAASQLNAGGSPLNLNIYVSGVTLLGDSTVLNGSVWGTNSSTGTITTGANSRVVGNLTTTTAGVINIGANGSVVGNLSTVAGAINVGDNATITGNISVSSAGAITIGANTTVSGFISSASGSGAGAGAVTVGGGSTVKGGISTDAGAVTVEVGATVGGNITTGDGAITVATTADVSGSVCTNNSGAITIGASAVIGGNVETATAGAITIGSKAIVSGDVKVEKAGATTIAADATVGSSRLGTGCALGAAAAKLAPHIIARDWRQLFMRG